MIKLPLIINSSIFAVVSSKIIFHGHFISAEAPSTGLLVHSDHFLVKVSFSHPESAGAQCSLHFTPLTSMVPLMYSLFHFGDIYKYKFFSFVLS